MKSSEKMPGGIRKRSSSVSTEPCQDNATSVKYKHSGSKTFGSLKPSALSQGRSSAHPNCPAHCQGLYKDGMWTHEYRCRYTIVLWYAHGYTLSDWTCPHNCTPTQIPSGLIHRWDCLFWDQEGREKTPIGLKPPKEH